MNFRQQILLSSSFLWLFMAFVQVILSIAILYRLHWNFPSNPLLNEESWSTYPTSSQHARRLRLRFQNRLIVWKMIKTCPIEKFLRIPEQFLIRFVGNNVCKGCLYQGLSVLQIFKHSFRLLAFGFHGFAFESCLLRKSKNVAIIKMRFTLPLHAFSLWTGTSFSL